MKKEISFNKPLLPEYLDSIRIKNLNVGKKQMDLEIIRYGADNMISINWNNVDPQWRLNIVK